MSSSNDTKDNQANQVPSEDNKEQTLRVARKQMNVDGQRKEIVVNDYAKAATLSQFLKDLGFPANKDKIVQFVQEQQKLLNNSENQDILSLLKKIEDKQYQNVFEVTNAAGLVR
ncbi:MAG TPA: DUF2795 domain-containing protein [Nitrososphaeraceae archaeon]|jgi:hypothetical protein|nr:DUF2795 domain-containing protein [Nitrososphaeraceae archaeon]